MLDYRHNERVSSGPNTRSPAEGPHLHVTVRAHPAATVVQVAGELDILTSPELDQAIVTAQADAPAVLVIDLTAVNFLSSSGLAVLTCVHERATRHGSRLRLVVASRATRLPIEICGLDRFIPIFPDVATALDAC